MTYRLKLPCDGFGCIMASYTSQHEIDIQQLREKGLFGTLLHEGGRIRFLCGPECAVLMMPCVDTFIPSNRRLHMKILGNAIATAHASFLIGGMIYILGSHREQFITPTQMNFGHVEDQTSFWECRSDQGWGWLDSSAKIRNSIGNWLWPIWSANLTNDGGTQIDQNGHYVWWMENHWMGWNTVLCDWNLAVLWSPLKMVWLHGFSVLLTRSPLCWRNRSSRHWHWLTGAIPPRWVWWFFVGVNLFWWKEQRTWVIVKCWTSLEITLTFVSRTCVFVTSLGNALVKMMWPCRYPCWLVRALTNQLVGIRHFQSLRRNQAASRPPCLFMGTKGL